jgi:uncharacterized protein
MLWTDTRLIVRPTYPGEDGEIRWLAVGMIGEKLWSAVYAERDDATRIISVRRARDREKEAYDDQDD